MDEHVDSPGKAVPAKVAGKAVPARRPSRYKAGDDPYVRQAMATLKEGESHDRFFEVLDSISEKKTAKGNAALIEAVMEYVHSGKAIVRKAATSCVLSLVVKNNEKLANAMVEMCHDPGTTEQRAVRLQALGRCGEQVPDLNSELESQKQRYIDLVAAMPAKRARVPEIKKKQAQIKQMRQEQGLEDDDDEKRNKIKRNSGLRDKLKGRQKSEAAQLEVELEELEKEILSLDSGSFLAEIQSQEDAWQKLRQRRIAFNSMLVDTLLSFVDDPEHRVSSAALSSLVDVSERGSVKVVCAILRYLSNPDRVDAVSIKLLGKTAPVGCAPALELLVRCLGAPGSAGDAALEVLGNIAVRGDIATLNGVLLQLEVGDLRTKARAIAAMPLVTHYGDQNALGKLRNLVSHRSWHVRVAAVKSLRSISQPDMGEEQAIPALLMCLQGDSEEVVRICALDALSVCAQRFDLPTLKLLVNCVTDSNLLVRRRAAILLARWSLAPTHTDDSAAISKASEAAAAEVTKAGTKDGVLLPGTKSRAQKAAAEAGASAAADAQRERKEYRQNLLTIVTQMLMHHVRCSDGRTSAAAAWSLGMLSCCGSCAAAGSVSSNLMQALHGATAVSKPFDDMRIHSEDLAESGVHVELAVTFESIFLLCDADDVEQLLCMVSLPTMIKHCVEALAELSRDLLKNATQNAKLGGQNPTNAPMHLFGNTSAEHLRDLIQSRLIALLEPSKIVDEAKASKSSKSSNISAADMAEKKGALQKAAARRWMAVLAMRRCALEALARHVLAVGANEASESEKLGAGSGASRGGHGGGANVRAHSRLFGNEHPLFEGLGAGGKRLKNTILPVLVSLIQVEQDPLVRRATTSLLLELYPAGARGDSTLDANERRQQMTGTVLDSIVARIQDMMQEDIQDQQLRATVAKEEKKEEQKKQNAVAWGTQKWGAEGSKKESGNGKVKVKSEEQIARDRLSMQAYVRLLGDFGALTEYDLFESALDKTMTGRPSLLLQALTASLPNIKVGTSDKEDGTADNEHVLMRLLDTVAIANSCYNFAPIRNLAVRALGIAMRGQPTAKSAELLLRVLTEGIDADSLIVVLAALLRMERLHEFSDVIDWPRHLRRIAQFLGHSHMAVQAMAEQVLHNQMHLRDSFIACTAEQMLHNQMHLRQTHQPEIQDALVTQLRCSSSLTRSRALGLLTSGHHAKSINISAVLTEAVTSCLYDHDTIVRSQAHDLLKLLTTATPASSKHRDSNFFYVGPAVAGGGLEGEGEGEVKADLEASQAALAASKEVGEDGRGSAAATWTATVDTLHPQQQQWDPMCVMIEGKPTRWSELMKEPPGERATVAAKKHWIGSLLTMKIFDQTSVAAVTEKLGASEHWSVRRSAVEYLHCALKAPPPPRAETTGAQSLQASALAAVDNEEAERSMPVGWENEAETARTALAYLKSEDAGVRNSAAAMLATLLPSGKGAREAILEQDSLEILLSDTRARQLCFKAFSSDGSMLEKCQHALKDDSILVRRSATGSMWALGASDPRSKALDMLLVCSRDPDLSVGASAMELWQKQDMAACDHAWRAAAVEKLSKHARHQREMGASRAVAVRALLALVHKGDAKVAAMMLDLLEDASVQVREAAADVLVEVADPTSDIVGHLIDVVERHVSDWNPPRRDGAEREIQAAAFWVLSRLEPHFSKIPDHIRSCGNRRIIEFLWGNADIERELIRQKDLRVWVRETLAAGDSLIVKVRRAISEGRWEDARNDANAAMAEYLLAKSKGSHPAIFERILMMDGIFSDIANFRGRTFERAIDTKIQAVDQSWVPPSDAIDNEGWTRLHYFSRWDMPGAIKKRVEEGADINAKVMAGTWKGCTCYDLARTEKLRDFIRDLGGGPSQPAFPEYSLEKPHIPRPKTAVRSRHVYTEQEIADLLPDSRSRIEFKDVSVLDAPTPSTWTPDKEGGNKVSAEERFGKQLCSIVPMADHAVNFVDTLSDDDA